MRGKFITFSHFVAYYILSFTSFYKLQKLHCEVWILLKSSRVDLQLHKVKHCRNRHGCMFSNVIVFLQNDRVNYVWQFCCRFIVIVISDIISQISESDTCLIVILFIHHSFRPRRVLCFKAITLILVVE